LFCNILSAWKHRCRIIVSRRLDNNRLLSQEIEKVLQVIHGQAEETETTQGGGPGSQAGFKSVPKSQQMAELDESPSVETFLDFSKAMEPKPLQEGAAAGTGGGAFSPMDCCGGRGGAASAAGQ